MSVSLTEQLIDIASRPVTDADRTKAALHVVDWFACALIGATSAAGRALARYAANGPSGPCMTLGSDRRDPLVAILVNGGLGNILEMDDMHRGSILHAGDTAIPASLAVAERDDLDGRRFLDAMVRGYETTIRIGMAAGIDHYRYWYNTASCGVFGSAMATGSLLGLDKNQLVDALGHAGMQSAGLWQCRIEPTFSKQLAAGRSAQSGFIAAELARVGFPGPHQILEGTHGFFGATCPNAAPEVVVADPDAPWRIYDVTFKPWPACRHVHAPVEVALKLRESIPPVDEIKAVEVTTYAHAIDFADNVEPATPHEARFSIQHFVAVALLRGEPTLIDCEMESINDPALAALRRKVRVRESKAMSGAYPNRFAAEIVVSWVGGEKKLEVATAKGDPENPMTTAEIEAKARMLFEGAGLPAKLGASLISSCHALAHGGSVRRLTGILDECRFLAAA